MRPTLELAVARRIVRIGARGRGGLTGTRTAGQLGRIPIECSMMQVHLELGHLGVPLYMPTLLAEPREPADVTKDWAPFAQLTFASFVDNVYFVSGNTGGALRLANRFEQVLTDVWRQVIRPSSREICLPEGVPSGKFDLGKWRISEGFKVLGVTLQHNSETDRTWEDTKATAKRIFWRIGRSVDYRSLAAPLQLRTLDRHILPFLAHRLTGVPLHTTRL